MKKLSQAKNYNFKILVYFYNRMLALSKDVFGFL